ncbi:MAG: formate dehydrogenase accessory sulfurtransferase FdhD [Acidobacteria bacterium]|nr:formate dehydrogenase accessory sulfurtransferase FdhD [Acidobacteriota bacterium]MCB9397299.1 formate dehydrogenase accessory sulfurtransferase FdhD [Acidobacteriota bacterium]
MNQPLKPFVTYKQDGQMQSEIMDWVLVEEPLQISVVSGQKRLELGVFLRTPGEDRALVCGLLRTSGIWDGHAEINVELSSSHGECGQATVTLSDPSGLADRADRLSLVHAGCGWCGSDLTEWACDQFVRPNDSFQISLIALRHGFGAFSLGQKCFSQSGGSHAAGLLNAQGELLLLAEDVGRHNAVDKVIGLHILGTKGPFGARALLLSGRAGFELVYKAAMVGIPLVASLGAPSSSAIELAREAGLTLISFVKDNRLNVYTHRQRFIHS